MQAHLTRWLRAPRRLARDARGTSSVEYVVLLTCIAVVCIAAWKLMGDALVRIISGE